MISIIVPTYNESENLPRLIPEIYHALSKIKDRFEIIIVDDDSPDLTWKIAEKYSRYTRYNLRVIRRTHDKGLSSAVIDGFGNSKGDILCVMDADLSHPPKLLNKMIEAMRDEGSDIVIATRDESGGRKNFSFYRNIVSLGAQMLSKPLTDVSDPMSGYFMIRKSVLKNRYSSLRPKGYKILLEILVKGNYDHKKVSEVPFIFAKRLHGESKLGFKAYIDYVIHVLLLYWYKIMH
ncbi:MAG: polyprenol monophosphomannose synthase [Candidatus Woesearchaeota archaeon]